MINCNVSVLSALASQLRLYHILFGDHMGTVEASIDVVPPDLVEQIFSWMQIARVIANDFELTAVHDRINIIEKRFRQRAPTGDQASFEMRVLLETIDVGLKGQLIYRYPTDKGKVLLRWADDWAVVARNFPSSVRDIHAGVDLWALGHNTASVFQMMRVLEHGLKALSADLGLIYQTQNWYNIINEITKKIGEQEKALPRGDAKAERLQFLSEAAKEFSYFKDGWRNYVSHAKCVYDERQAGLVMEHVRQFMTTLGRHLGEIPQAEGDPSPSQTIAQSHPRQALAPSE